MTPSLLTEFFSLVKLMQAHLEENSAPKEWLYVEKESYDFFKAHHTKNLNKPSVKQVTLPQEKKAPLRISTPPPKQASPPMPSLPVKPVVNKPEASPPVAEPIMPTPAPKPTSSKTKKFSLQPLEKIPDSDFTGIKKTYQELFPQETLLIDAPDDSEARALVQAWKESTPAAPILILCFNESEKEKLFLKNLAKALRLTYAPAALVDAPKVEQDNGWDALLASPTLKLIITSDYPLYNLAGAMKLYREEQRQALRFLKKTPLFLLSDISLYLKEAHLKGSLWQALKSFFESKLT